MGIITLLILAAGLFGIRQLPDKTIKGIVKDAISFQPITGVTITEKGTRNSTISDADGRFELTMKSAKSRIECNAVGYDQSVVSISASDTTVTILLKQSSLKLEEVVVTGYSKKDNTVMQDMIAYAPAKQLNGKASGIAITRSKGISQMERKYQNRPEEKEFNTEGYAAIMENKFLTTGENPLSTFSIDVDAASYSNLRRYLNAGELPPAGAVRSEELINYFDYQYDGPADQHPFAVHTALMTCPWNNQHQLVSIGLQGKKIPVDKLPASNLVFLIDVSGSMQDENKLPLVKSSLKLLTDQLREQDHVSLVVYAGSAGVVLSPTAGNNKAKIKDAIDALEAGGSTAGGEGIRLAYKMAREAFRKNGNNRVILCTDGDFNVGESSDAAMEKLIEKERESGVFLTVLGYGMGNYQDSKMQLLADKGNGNHAYIDGMAEAKKVLVSEFGGTLFTIAKDVKLQIEFNPSQVQAYRLIGYENRLLAKEDFNNDKKDAGDMGSGHTVTALYEIIPVGVANAFKDSVDGLKYQQLPVPLINSNATEVMTIKLRYKKPDGDKSELLSRTVTKGQLQPFLEANENARFATAVAAWGMLLNQSHFLQQASYEQVLSIAGSALGNDRMGYRKEFLELVKKAERISKDGDAKR